MHTEVKDEYIDGKLCKTIICPEGRTALVEAIESQCNDLMQAICEYAKREEVACYNNYNIDFLAEEAFKDVIKILQKTEKYNKRDENLTFLF